MTHMDMDAAVRLVERRQEQRRRAAQEIATGQPSRRSRWTATEAHSAGGSGKRC